MDRGFIRFRHVDEMDERLFGARVPYFALLFSFKGRVLLDPNAMERRESRGPLHVASGKAALWPIPAFRIVSRWFSLL
jgi:hypothetical protein